MIFRLKEKALRLYGDHGADTLNSYFVQLEYTAGWCIQMLLPREGIAAVIPEGIEDLVIERPDHIELRQIKTRTESQGPWTTALVLPHLCDQYHRRTAFAQPCSFHFVTNARADTKTRYIETSLGPLFRLKELVSIVRAGQGLNPDEQEEWDWFRRKLPSKIVSALAGHSDDVDEDVAWQFVEVTHLETDEVRLHRPYNPRDLQEGLAARIPGFQPLSVSQLDGVYERLLLLVIGRVRSGLTIAERRIEAEDVLGCLVAPAPLGDGVDWDSVPGQSMMEKKAHLGGFDNAELRRYLRHLLRARSIKREITTLNLGDDLDQFTDAALELQHGVRRRLSASGDYSGPIGPAVFEVVKPELKPLAERILPTVSELDDRACSGLLWDETDLCNARWDALQGSDL